MTTFFNGTPHSINIISKDSCVYNESIRKWVSGDPQITRSIEPSGSLLNATFVVAEGEPVDGIPVVVKTVSGCDPQPDTDIIICSALYASAVQKTGGDMTRIFVIADPVFSEDGRTVLGCLAIQPFI